MPPYEPNHPTFVKNRSEPSEIKKSIPNTLIRYSITAFVNFGTKLRAHVGLHILAVSVFFTLCSQRR
jgi:hypothetical protein